MPGVQSESDEVHESGREDDSSVGELGSVQSEKLAESEDMTCGVTTLIVTENGRIRVRCTLDARKHKVHWDKVFSKEWS